MQERIAAEAARREAQYRIGAGFAGPGDIARHLSVGLRQVPVVVQQSGLSANPMGRFLWQDIWRVFWQIATVPSEHFRAMQAPALSNEDLARRFGVCARTIRRHGAPGMLPPHLDLGPRLRRHLPLRIAFWEAGEALPLWLCPATGSGRLALRPRHQGTGPGLADSPAGSGQ